MHFPYRVRPPVHFHLDADLCERLHFLYLNKIGGLNVAEKLSEKADKGLKKLGKDADEGLKKIGKDIDKGVKKIAEETDKGIKKLHK